MQADDVLALLAALDDRGVCCWLDGGWGVDALLAAQSRRHSDVDLVVDRSHLDHATAYLSAAGFTVLRDWLPTSVAFRDAAGREVDLHPVDGTPDGGGDQVLPEGQGRWHYGPPVDGSVAGQVVRCASAEEQLRMHVGYEPRSVDVEDVRRLAERFGLPLPEPYGGAPGSRDSSSLD